MYQPSQVCPRGRTNKVFKVLRSISQKYKTTSTKSRSDKKLSKANHNQITMAILGNDYRRFIPGTTQTQGTLNDALKGEKKKGKIPVEWTPERENVKVKESLAQATLLAHPDAIAELRLITYVKYGHWSSTTTTKQDWQPLAFLNKKLSDAQTKYSPYDREFLAIYVAMRYFRHMLGGHQFSIMTDYKPLHLTKIHCAAHRDKQTIWNLSTNYNN